MLFKGENMINIGEHIWKKIVSIILFVIIVFMMTIQTFCLPNDLVLYGIKPLVIQSENFNLIYGDKLILGGDSFDITSEITEVFKDNTGEESLVKEVAIRKFTEFINKLDYTSITFQTKDDKKIKLTKEEIINKIK